MSLFVFFSLLCNSLLLASSFVTCPVFPFPPSIVCCSYKVITAALRQKFRMPTESRLKERLNKMHITDAGAVRMLENLLSLNPIKRMTAAEAASVSDTKFVESTKHLFSAFA